MKKKLWIIFFLLAVITNILGWFRHDFCDWYICYIFPVLSGGYARLMSFFSFSVGEWMLIFAVLFLFLWLLTAILYFFRKERWLRCFFFWQCRFFCWAGLIIFWIMTCNCFLLYHGSEFEEAYMEPKRKDGYSNEELALVRDFIVENLNELSQIQQRDSQGRLLYEGDLHDTAIDTMRQLGETYDRLAGYYPQPKGIYFSGLLSQSYMMGYYFPFSMEANYNRIMYISNKPAVICHELAHLKGFILEDEANLIGYLACISSEDLFFRYSGYLSVLSYVENEFVKSVGNDLQEYRKHPSILKQVYEDNIFLTQEAWQEVEEKAVADTQTVKNISNAATDVTLKLNGVTEGINSYEGVVKLLLEYYEGELFASE